MPSQRPRAQFEPIPPNLSLTRLVEAYEHFDFCPRIPFEAIQENGVDNFEKLVKKHVIGEGKPLVVEGLNNVLDPWTFSSKWLKDNEGQKVENARDLNQKDFIPLTIRHYLNNINAVTSQHFRPRTTSNDRPPQRIYLKDIDCPEVWRQKLAEVIPPFLFYLNDSTGEYGGPGAGVVKDSTAAGRRLGRGIATAGDLMSSLPPEMRAENLMCYIGHEGTYTPSHREMCATMGHNIMVEASSDFDEDGKPERPGSSIWFMTEAKDRHTVAEFWLSKLGHDIEVENHFAQINSWKLAPFKVYIVDQKPGDFILIPPLAPHQVWNRGTRTMKVAWNRSSVETLEMAISEALPKARIVCRDEQYKNKAMIYYSLNKYSELLLNAKAQADKLPPDAGHALLYKGKVRGLQRDFRRLFALFKNILLSEMFSPDGTGEKCEFLPFESNVTCAYCRGNIFNRFLSCNTCKDALGYAEDEPYDVCMECYAMGRSCYCISGQQWVEQFKWKELITKYEFWRQQIITLVGDVDRSTPLPLLEERKRMTRKPLAEVVLEQLKRRPFKDPKKPKEEHEDEEASEEEVIVDDEGRVKKTIKKHSKAWLKKHSTCHVCKYRHENWKMARCTRCDRWWCFGSLFRGHDDMPLDVMENPDWECAHCQGVCFAGACRQDPRQTPYQPKGTLLGHDTKKVADARSVEVLVDFSVSNLNWIREEQGSDESTQLRRAREEAERAKESSNVDDEEDAEADALADEAQETPIEYAPENELIDPELRSETDLARRLTQFNQSIPAPRANMQRESHAPNGYVPAETSGYAANYPEEDSYLYTDPYGVEESNYPDLNNENVEGMRPFLKKGHKPYAAESRKRGHRAIEGDATISMEKPKRRRVTEQVAEALAAQQSTSQANRQYQGIKERKAIEEAKRKGRFFSVSAALRGKKKLVRLHVDPARLADILSRPPLRQNPPSDHAPPARQVPTVVDLDAPDLLRSDIAPVTKPVTAKPSPGKRRRKTNDSDASDDSLEDDEDIDSTYNRRKTKGEPRRISAYLQARHKDMDLPDELPDNFRDGRARPRPSGGGTDDPAQETVQRNMPARSKTGKWLPAPKPAKTTSSDSPSQAQPSTGRPRGRPSKQAIHPRLSDLQSSAPQASRPGRPASITEAEKNRLAKLDALRTARNEEDASDPDDVDMAASIQALAESALAVDGNDDVVMAAPVAKMVSSPKVNVPAPMRKSILDRKMGPGGRKIKIISARKVGAA
ncbi:hypothetical protein ANO11243_008060 [Dothideomycetidae sp. 11243]|nr:hypothetical protein ANO11243_008060 [fungal sp. No.11243]